MVDEWILIFIPIEVICITITFYEFLQMLNFLQTKLSEKSPLLHLNVKINLVVTFLRSVFICKLIVILNLEEYLKQVFCIELVKLHCFLYKIELQQ